MDGYPETGYTPANLRHLRHQRHLTQTELGKLLGVALRTVQQWEANIDKATHADMPHRQWLELQKIFAENA